MNFRIIFLDISSIVYFLIGNLISFYKWLAISPWDGVKFQVP